MKVQHDNEETNATSESEKPPPPPPRKLTPLPPPPLPPPPSASMLTKLKSYVRLPLPPPPLPDYQLLHNVLLQKVQTLHLSHIPSTPSHSSYPPSTQSPSSGFYSAGSVSPISNVSFEFDSAKPHHPAAAASATAALPPVAQYVKSTRVEKPLPQTAVIPPPQPKDPPSYTFIMQQRRSETNTPVKYQSPVPQRKQQPVTGNAFRECRIKNYSPQAFKFFMEQHVENVVKSYKQRIYRRMQLEREMAKIGLSSEARCQMRKMLSQKESNYNRLKRAKIDKSMFSRIKLIGVGAFGEVSLVRKMDTNQLYAMKTLRKADVLKRNQIAHVKAERDILAEADNEWVVKLYYSFQDSVNLYFVMEYIPGGDLMSLLIKMGIFEESLARFYIAELTCAVESVHKIGFIHRDIKPDNILIDRDGHIKLTDFGLCTGFRWTHNSKYYQNAYVDGSQDSLDAADIDCKCKNMKPLDRRRRREQQRRCLAHSLVGTPNYIAPEVLLRTGYTQLCDWWSVGVVLYEMLIGSPPFSAGTPTETQYKIINWKKTLRIPQDVKVSAEAIDLIVKLCTSPDQRLGKKAEEVKSHPFFAGIDFEKSIRKITPPYVPTIHFLTDTSNFDPVESPESVYTSSAESDMSAASSENAAKSFHGFYEFTFRRFFDGEGMPFAAATATASSKHNLEECDSQVAIYV